MSPNARRGSHLQGGRPRRKTSMPEVRMRLLVGTKLSSSPCCVPLTLARHYLVPFSDQILDVVPVTGECCSAHHRYERFGDLNALAPLRAGQLLVLDVVGGYGRIGAIHAPGGDDVHKKRRS